jgi:LPXTG-motif cell wall-anchored protein
VFSSTGYSFEIDNIAVAPVPEASTWVFMIAGVGLIGGVLWLRRRKDQGATPGDAMAKA